MSRVISLISSFWLAGLVALVVAFPACATVSLEVTIDPGASYIGALNGIKLNYMLSGPQPYAGVMVMDNNGKAILNDLEPGAYELSLFGSHWIKRVITGINVNGVNSVHTSLANGDADGDGQVNLFDLAVLDSKFDCSDPMADLDGDGQVNLMDYVLIDANFGAQGDISAYTSINPIDGAEMVWVPAGAFTMGNNAFADAKPQRQVSLNGYWVYKYEVTVAQYRMFCTATNRSMPETLPSWGWQANQPIVFVRWSDASAYCSWAGVRLPTEAEWEKAARGTDARLYPWGNEWDNMKCSYWGNSGYGATYGPKPVGSYASGVSPYGCNDIVGNVSEWCNDWYNGNYYASAPSSNPQGPESSEYGCRVVRGNTWGFIGDDIFQCAYRSYYGPASGNNLVGFRCVKTP